MSHDSIRNNLLCTAINMKHSLMREHHLTAVLYTVQRDEHCVVGEFVAHIYLYQDHRPLEKLFITAVIPLPPSLPNILERACTFSLSFSSVGNDSRCFQG